MNDLVYCVVKQIYIMYPWVFNVYMDEIMKEVKMGMDEENGSELVRKGGRIEIVYCMQMT